jgi:radical SAM superfamily enzyme YgiQ (UPF0313 family)
VNILLANPKSSVWHTPKVPSLGLGYIAAVLENDGHAVAIWDAGVEPREPDLAGYDLVGATATTPQVKAAWSLLERAKAAGAVTVLGGPHAACLPEGSLALKCVDFVVRGEGEETVAALARAVSSGESAAGINGLSFWGADGVVHEADRAHVRDLDSLPFPAHHLLSGRHRYTGAQPLLRRRTRSLPILTSRGCPHDCAFCYRGIFGRTFRARSPGNVVAEWEHLATDLGAREIAVQDDVFNYDQTRAIEICRRIADLGLRVPWCTPNGLRADHVSVGLFAAMKSSGCERVAFGVESGSQSVLDALGKRETIAQMREAFGLAREAGLETMGFFMFGNLGENAAAMEETIDLAVSLKPTYAQFTMATPYPGTRLYEAVRREGELLVDDWERYGHYTSQAFFRHGSVTPELVQEKMRRAYRRFYLRLPFAASFGLKLSTWRNIGAVVRGAWHLLAKA